MSRRVLMIPLLLLAVLVMSGCRYDYFFLAFEIECEFGDDVCYEKGRWTRFYCARFESSPFELMAGPYKLELDMDIPALLQGQGGFPRKLQTELKGYDADGDMAFKVRSKRWKVDRQSGRVEETLNFAKDMIVPVGGELCLDVKPIGGEIRPGWLAGVLFEPIVEAN